MTSSHLTAPSRTRTLKGSMGAVGAAGDNAMMESFWARLQVEVLNRRRWKTRIELATAIHDYIQFHNTRRRHSSLQMRTPSEIEHAWTTTNVAVVRPDLARTASTVVVARARPVGLAGTSEADVSIDHQHLLLNNDHAA